ncbi:MAG TPA: choice-of-anchor D domain-containing protein [Candidatus Kryptonia bacterium]
MRAKVILCFVAGLVVSSFANAGTKYHARTIAANADTIYIPGGTLLGAENAGSTETTINNDTIGTARRNPNRVYALYEGQVYYQLAPINVYDPGCTLTIVGVPSSYGTTKPIILVQPTNGMGVGLGLSAGTSTVNEVCGSIKLVNIHYQTMEMDGSQTMDLFSCSTANNLPQRLTIDNCLFEFSKDALFDCFNPNESAGGYPHEAEVFITNSYFRNMFNEEQWWGSRIFECDHPVDTLWFENNTVTTPGLMFCVQQGKLTDFAYFNHNTIINSMKDWLLSPFYHELYITNNIFVNQNWVGEDTNVTYYAGLDPDSEFMSTINIDSVNAKYRVVVPQKYYAGDSSHYTSDLFLCNMRVYVSNNVNYDDSLLINGYYKSPTFVDPALGTPPSYLSLIVQLSSNGPWKINNLPAEWMNQRTQASFSKYRPGGGYASPDCGFVEEETSAANPNMQTPGIADASVVTSMGEWTQSQWMDPRFFSVPPPNITGSKYIYGDYNPQTIPGYKTENGSGITRFTDLTENFGQSSVISQIDGLPVGSLIWNDADLASYNSSEEWQKVQAAYLSNVGGVLLSDRSIAFGPVLSHSTKLDTLRITNYASQPFIIDSVTTGTKWFVTSSIHDTLNYGNSLGLSVAFTPDTALTYSDTLFIFGNSTAPLRKVPLSGSKAVPQVVLNQLRVEFGQVCLDSTKTDTIKITNSSIATLSIDSVYTKTKWFKVSSVQEMIVFGDTLDLPISFKPDTTVTYSDTLYILSNSTIPIIKVPLSGIKAVPQISVYESGIDYSSIHKGSVVIDTVKITNASPASLIIDSLYTGTKYFTVASIHDTVTICDTLRLLVSFAPDTSGIWSDTLYILSNSVYRLTKFLLGGNRYYLVGLGNRNGIPASYGLSQNYPNPFNPTTVINYQLPMNSHVTLRVYDVLGREVVTLVNENESAGYKSVNFNASNLPSGVYFYRIQAGTYSATKKLLLLK